MTVRKIVEAKKIKDIVTTKPTDSVTDAAHLLARYKIGAVIVSHDGSAVDGILSERDIVRALGTTGVDCMTKQVKDLMTREVTGCRMDDTANSAMETMSSGRFRHMPVVEDGKLVGVISIGDVVQARINEIQSENSALTGMISNNW